MEVLRELCRESVTGVDISTGMLTVGRERLGTDGSPFPAGVRDDGAPLLAGAHSEGAPVVGSLPGGGARSVDPAADGTPLSGRAAPGAGRPPMAPVRGAVPPAVSWVRGDARALPFGSVFDVVVSFGAFGHFLPRELPGLFAGVHAVLRPGGRFAFPVVAPPRPGSPWYWLLLGFDTVMRVRNAVRRPTFVMYYRTFRLGDVRRELARAGFRTELHVLPEFGSRRDGSPRARLVVATREDTALLVTRPPEG
jgi:SAM-dependent methyltransferase